MNACVDDNEYNLKISVHLKKRCEEIVLEENSEVELILPDD